jgi:hypothetical protein
MFIYLEKAEQLWAGWADTSHSSRETEPTKPEAANRSTSLRWTPIFEFCIFKKIIFSYFLIGFIMFEAVKCNFIRFCDCRKTFSAKVY